MKIFLIIFGIAIIGLIAALVYEIKYTYRDNGLW